MSTHGYKKYMKKDTRINKQGSPLIQVFVFSFFGMLLLFTLIISYMSKVMTVDTSIGEYREQQIDDMEDKKIIDVNRLEMIKNEDQGRNFSDLMQNPNDTQQTAVSNDSEFKFPQEQTEQTNNAAQPSTQPAPVPQHDVFYKVYIGSYTSAEQAKVAKEIIMESGSALNPIVKQTGSNEYTLQVGIFKNKQSAETMLSTIKSSNLPGRIEQGY